MSANARRRVVVWGSHFVLFVWIASSSEGLCTPCQSHYLKQFITYLGISGYLRGSLGNIPLGSFECAQTQRGVVVVWGLLSMLFGVIHSYSEWIITQHKLHHLEH
jgi:hypothetical protein